MSGTRLGTYSFEWEEPATEALVIAVFGIQLFRYNGQGTIPLNLGRGRIVLETRGGQSTCRELISQVESGRSRAGGLAEAIAGEPRAAVTWLDARRIDLPAVLKGLESDPVDLRLVVFAGGTRGIFIYNDSLFKAASIERFARHWRVLLAGARAELGQAVSRLPLLTPAEKGWLAEVSEGARREFPGGAIFERVEAHAVSTPDAVAVRYRDEALTYRELNARANRLANELVARGVGSESRVIVCVEPSFDIAIALLGILKAGAVYVPLEPTYPPARIRAILDDTRPALVISRAPLVQKLALTGYPVLELDTQAEKLEKLSPENPAVTVALSQTAYIYYTSGTTGAPKGVMASHANLVFYIQVAQERYGFDAREVMPAIARFSFSISMFELLSPLVAGGTLVVLDREHVLDLERMARTMGEVTFFHAGPSLLKNLLPQIRRRSRTESGTYDFSAYSRVRHASSGGDMVSPEILEELKAIFSTAEVFVIYGCSEISCMGCTFPAPREETIGKSYVGKPFDNTSARVVDAAFNSVPAGVVGEIVFSGGGVVKGYLNRPELTDEKFVELDGRRFYRTGDLGRLSPDGWIEILGRNDFQIKVRGMRIELGEVEHCLRQAPGVREGVVMAKGGPDGEKVLVAYVVSHEGSGDAAGERKKRMATVRRHMAENLPDYMVPALYVELAAMPLNNNMKLDRHALPEPERETTGEGAREPRSEAELGLAALWKKLLGLEGVGVDDNFFELGGHSLLAMELIAAVENNFGVVLEGMEVLRESLEVLASFCELRSGRSPPQLLSRSPPQATEDRVEMLQFGPDQALFGVLWRRGQLSARHAVLVCPPLGQELVRSHFILSRLGKLLSAAGVPVLRFDYYGCWDSLGESREATCSRWQDDIVSAYAELRRRTGAERITGIGVRLGATLLCGARDRLDLSRVVLWDPVASGADFYAEQSEMHRKYLRGTRHLRQGGAPRAIQGGEELLGATYSDRALGELKKLSISPAHAAQSRNLITSSLGFECGWNELSQLDDVLPDVGIARALAALVEAKT